MTTRTLFILLITILVLAGCTKGPSPNLCPTVCDGLVAYYPFYGDATDKSGNGHDLSVLGPTLSKDRNGYQNHSYLFDGRTTHLRFAKPLPNLGGAYYSCNMVQGQFIYKFRVDIFRSSKSLFFKCLPRIIPEEIYTEFRNKKEYGNLGQIISSS